MIPRDELDSREIEVVADAWGRIPVVLLLCDAHHLLAGACPRASAVDFHVSISRHDSDHAITITIAIAIAVLVR